MQKAQNKNSNIILHAQ